VNRFAHDSRARGRVVGVRAAMTLVATLLGTACGGGHTTNRALDPANLLPFGSVDTPRDGARVPKLLTIGGWAMDDRGIQNIRVYIDGHFVTTLQLNTDRPDVSKAYPQYARGTTIHGWTGSVVLETPGQHTVVVQAVDSDGATKDIGVVKLTCTDQ
jgi:hypothetical protein